MTEVWSVDPRTGQRVARVAAYSSMSDAEQAARVAVNALPVLEGIGRGGRAQLLDLVAEELDTDREGLIGIADQETALGPERLDTELTRTTNQLRMFAGVLRDGEYLEAVIEHPVHRAGATQPDLRRMLIPIGPIIVFGASNFPFAFSVLGGDTAAALAAGCPAIVKVHSGHPATSVRTHAAWQRAAQRAGISDDALQLVFGVPAARMLVEHPTIKAVSFTGSVTVGRSLFDLASARPDPIPFFGELAGVNPFVVTPAAAAARAEQIAVGLAASVTLGAGQFCTKPGLVFVPEGDDGDRVVASLSAAFDEAPGFTMLTSTTRDSYRGSLDAAAEHSEVSTLFRGPSPEGTGFDSEAALLAVDIDRIDGSSVREYFGPATTTVRYSSREQLIEALQGLEGALTATIHGEDSEDELIEAVLGVAMQKAGRVIFNGYPTGVAVTAAMTHGGPWPSTTNAQHSSVGTTAIRRFLRPVTLQNAPATVLPAELQDGQASVPRRVDGVHEAVGVSTLSSM
ncbi:aldehyde dehydrogenase (NADP(+)) [Okibacterium endophyticum]